MATPPSTPPNKSRSAADYDPSSFPMGDYSSPIDMSQSSFIDMTEVKQSNSQGNNNQTKKRESSQSQYNDMPSSPIDLSSALSPPTQQKSRKRDSSDSQGRTMGADEEFNTGDDFHYYLPNSNVDALEVGNALSHFLNTFRETTAPSTDADLIVEDEPYYHKTIREAIMSSNYYINFDYAQLQKTDKSLAGLLIRYPLELFKLIALSCDHIAQHSLQSIANTQNQDQLDSFEIRPFNLDRVTSMRNLNPSDVDQLIAIRGMVTRTSPIIPDLKKACFKCLVCDDRKDISLDRGRVEEPTGCTHCGTKYSMKMIHNLSIFHDKQMIKLQETPDTVPEGETPQTVNLVAYSSLVDKCKPGDRVEITGVFRSSPIRISPHQRHVRSIYRTYMDVYHIKKLDRGIDEEQKSSMDLDEEQAKKINISPEKEKLFQGWAKNPEIYNILVKSLAPSIWEMEDVKKGILCQLFGGSRKEFKEEGAGKVRGEINVLLCGDPGSGKSQLLQYVHKLAPRGIYTSGKGSSAVGLTAYVTRDPDTRLFVLESGALVLSDRGICCIDEFDKMSDQTRSILHEVMEQQTVSVAKAGIICTLNARTSILASANPTESRYNPKLSVVENIQLPPTLLSRFDLIYLVLDKPNELSDRRLAQHLVSLYYSTTPSSANNATNNPNAIPGIIPVPLLKEYVSYARKKVQPVLSDNAATSLVHGYVAMRRLGGNKKTITATPRQLESLIRIAEALAKMRLSEVVERSDVEEALRLVKVAIQQAAIDPRTGTIDMDLITTGRSASSRTRAQELAREIKSLLAKSHAKGAPVRLEQLHSEISAQSAIEVAANELREALRLLEDEDVITTSGDRKNLSITLVSKQD